MCWLGQKALTQAISVALSEKKWLPKSLTFLWFQHMMMEDEAKRAIMELNGCMLNGNRLNVEVPENTFASLRECGLFA